MKEMWKKFIAWMRCENENIPEWMTIRYQNIYSENIKHLPIHGEIGPDDILQLSHKLDNGGWETCYVTIKQLRDAIVNKIS